MYLFFDGVSSDWYIWLFDENRALIASESFLIHGNESTQTIPVIDSFLKKQSILYEDIENIVTVVGPWSFTGIRTISLVVNSLSYIYPNIYLTAYNFFDLYDRYPIVKASSKRDLFVKWEKSATIAIIQNEDFNEKIQQDIIYGDINLERFSKNIEIKKNIDYEDIFQNIELSGQKQVAPLYIKKPNIS